MITICLFITCGALFIFLKYNEFTVENKRTISRIMLYIEENNPLDVNENYWGNDLYRVSFTIKDDEKEARVGFGIYTHEEQIFWALQDDAANKGFGVEYDYISKGNQLEEIHDYNQVITLFEMITGDNLADSDAFIDFFQLVSEMTEERVAELIGKWEESFETYIYVKNKEYKVAVEVTAERLLSEDDFKITKSYSLDWR